MQLIRERPRPFVYAVLVHLVLIAVLVFSLDWAPSIKPSASSKPAPVQAVVVDSSVLEAEQKRKQQLEEQKQREADAKKRAAEEAKRKAAAEKKRRADAERKRKAEAAAEKKRKSELAQRKKAEAEKKRKAEAERKKAEAERRKQEEVARQKAEAEKKRQAEEARRKAEAEKKRLEEEARRKAAEQEMQARLAAEREREASQRRSAMQSIVAEYSLYIQEKVQRSWIRPPSSGRELSCTVEVRLIPGGEVIEAKIVRSSGNAVFDRSVEAAVFKASPLPVPSDPEVMDQYFRSLRFEFKPGSL